MTKEEAVEISYRLLRKSPPYSTYSNAEIRQAAESNVDISVALGMLKLDEPKSARDKFKEVLARNGYGPGSIEYFISEISAAGLKIIEK